MSALCTIRTATENDCGLLLEFIRALATYEKLLHEVSATENSLRETLFCPHPHARAIIAEQDGKPAGFCLFFYNYSTFLGRYGIYIEDLYVQESHRGAGIGGALLRHVAQLAVAAGCGRVEWSVLDWNQPAIDVYRRAGAVGMDEWTIFRLTGEALQKYVQAV